jgi:hypothetical protein
MQRSVRSAVGRAEAGPLLGMLGGALGALAGLMEVTIGPAIRSWVGNKQDTTGLGTLTTLLSVVAFAAAWSAARHPDLAPGRRAAVVALLWIPAGICFTTVGALWYLPGPLLIVSGLLIVRGYAGRRA